MKKSMGAKIAAWNWWQEIMETQEDHPAIYHADGSVWGTFGEMHVRASQQAKRWVTMLEAAHGKSVVCSISAPSNPSWPAALLALWKCDATVLLLPSVSNSQRERIEQCAGAQWRLEGNASGEWFLRRLPHTGDKLPWNADLLKATSGSTGQPKLIGFTSEQLRADAAQILEAMNITKADRNFGVIPFSHSYGFSNLITPLLFFGVPLVCAPDPLPRAIGDALQQSKATVWPAVPAMFSPLLQSGFTGTPHLRTVISAGAPLAASLARNFHQHTGLAIHSFYGSSECGGICYDRDGKAMEIDGWIGTPMPAVKIRELPTENDAIAIEIRGEAVGLGCIPQREGDALQDGGFRPADLLQPLNGGYRLVGRMDDMANLGGRKVHPSEVEAVLIQMPGVQAVVVCKVTGRGGEELLAVIESPEATELSVLRKMAGDLLPEWQIPRHWKIVRQLPITERGKINRNELARLWMEDKLTTD